MSTAQPAANRGTRIISGTMPFGIRASRNRKSAHGKLPQSGKLAPKWRKEFEAAGYAFGRTVINVIRCPACPKDAKSDSTKLLIKAEIENLLAGDEDGLAATYEDHGL